MKDHVKSLSPEVYSKLNVILQNYNKTVTFVRLKKRLGSKEEKKNKIPDIKFKHF